MFNRKQLFMLFWPAFIEQTLVVSVGFISTLLVAGVSAQAVSGIGLVESVNMVIISVLTAIAAGAAVVVSQKLGAEEYKNASSAAGDSLSVAIIISTVIGILVVIFAKPIVMFIFDGAEELVLENAVIYFRFSGISYPFLASSTTLSSIFRAARDARTPMFASGIANITMIIVSLFMIRLLGLGIYGSGTALIFARISSTVFLYIQIKRRRIRIRIPRISIRPKGEMLGDILRISIPCGIDQFLFSGGKLIISTFLKNFGTDSITANSINGNIFGIANIPGTTMLLVAMTVIGQLYGAQRYNEVRRYMFLILGATTIGLLVACLGFMPMLEGFISLYNQSEECNTIAYDVTTVTLVVMPFLWPASFVIPQMLRATGDVKYTMIISVASMFTARIFGAWYFSVYLGLGLMGIWYAMFIDWFIRSLFFAPRAFLCYWNKEYRMQLKTEKQTAKI